MPKRKRGRVFQAWTPHIWSNSNLIRWGIWSELAAILSSFAGRGFRSRVCRIIRTARPLLTRLMSPLVRGGDIHPQPGPIRQCKESAKFDIPKAVKANVKVAHLNVRSLKSRENFCLVKDTILHNGFDIFTVSETWADLSVSDASLEISGYQLFRQDRGQHKAGGGLCTYAKSNLKITVLENLSSACDDGFQQLWLRVQCRKYKSFLICNTYRLPQTPTTCFESLANSLTDALLLDLNVVILSDLNCNLLAPDPETTADLYFNI